MFKLRGIEESSDLRRLTRDRAGWLRLSESRVSGIMEKI